MPLLDKLERWKNLLLYLAVSEVLISSILLQDEAQKEPRYSDMEIGSNLNQGIVKIANLLLEP